MRGLLVCSILLLAGAGLVWPQGIRKNYTEMTAAEQSAYRDALVSLYDANPSNDLAQIIASFHSSNFSTIHYPSTESQNQFLAWHRAQIWEMEDAIQRQNSKLTIPYWDWRVNNQSTDNLFQSFLPLTDLPWTISRAFPSSASLPNSTDVATIQGNTLFWDDPVTGYTNDLERGIVHGGPHNWIGGTMAGGASPLDPVFYLHHGMVDKLWQQWEQVNQGSAFTKTSLSRYDGSTNSPYFSPLPLINPNDIVDIRTSMGIFYTDGSTAILDGGYAVTNAYRNPEHFVYQHSIIASDFEVPETKSAVIHSNSKIILQPGFVTRGSLVLKVGGYDANFPTAKVAVTQLDKPQPTGVSVLQPGILRVARASGGLEVAVRINENAPVLIEAYDPAGRKLSLSKQTRIMPAGEHSLQVPLNRGYYGLIYLRVKAGKNFYQRIVSPL